LRPSSCTAAAVVDRLSLLKYRNAHGSHIYIPPSGEHRFTALDDLHETSLARLAADGFNPCAVVETSTVNFQAWLKHTRIFPKLLGTFAAQTLAERYEADPIAKFGTSGYHSADCSRRMYLVNLSGVSPRLNGWQFIGAIDVMSDEGNQFVGNMLRSIPGVEMPERFAPRRCTVPLEELEIHLTKHTIVISYARSTDSLIAFEVGTTR
jgi:RepB DNA-primase from phage plasmid